MIEWIKNQRTLSKRRRKVLEAVWEIDAAMSALGRAVEQLTKDAERQTARSRIGIDIRPNLVPLEAELMLLKDQAQRLVAQRERLTELTFLRRFMTGELGDDVRTALKA